MKNMLRFCQNCIVKNVIQYLRHRRNILIILGHVMPKICVPHMQKGTKEI